jgi:hypothetical protein
MKGGENGEGGICMHKGAIKNGRALLGTGERYCSQGYSHGSSLGTISERGISGWPSQSEGGLYPLYRLLS